MMTIKIHSNINQLFTWVYRVVYKSVYRVVYKKGLKSGLHMGLRSGVQIGVQTGLQIDYDDDDDEEGDNDDHYDDQDDRRDHGDHDDHGNTAAEIFMASPSFLTPPRTFLPLARPRPDDLPPPFARRDAASQRAYAVGVASGTAVGAQPPPPNSLLATARCVSAAAA